MLCGTTDNPTDEHIVPQALLEKRWGLDPNKEDLARFRTTLCGRHNGATATMHAQPNLMDLVADGEPITSRSLDHLSHWIVWVTLLLGLARGSGIVPSETARTRLLNRFDGLAGGLPPRTRVYAARWSEYVEGTGSQSKSHEVALRGDSSVSLDYSGTPNGYSVGSGRMSASESIGLGAWVLLVLGDTYPSGQVQDHRLRLDAAAAEVGLERIFPPPNTLPALTPISIDIGAVRKVFTLPGTGTDHSLLPPNLRLAYELFHVQEPDS